MAVVAPGSANGPAYRPTSSLSSEFNWSRACVVIDSDYQLELDYFHDLS